MKYMFLLYNPESDAPPTEEEMGKWMEFGQHAGSVAAEVSGAPLQPSATATTVSVRNGKTITTDGPFAEAKEMIGGYYVYDCKDLDQAIDLASRIPWVPTGYIEVRPVTEFE